MRRHLHLLILGLALAQTAGCSHVAAPPPATAPVAAPARPVRAALRSRLLSATISGNGANVSDVLVVDQFTSCDAQLVTTGTVAGTWKVEANVDPTAGFADITTGFTPSITNPSGTAMNQMIAISSAIFSARFTLTVSSGTGTASVYAHCSGS